MVLCICKTLRNYSGELAKVTEAVLMVMFQRRFSHIPNVHFLYTSNEQAELEIKNLAPLILTPPQMNCLVTNNKVHE